MKRFAKFLIIATLIISCNTLYAQSATADSTKSTTAANAPASSNPAIEPGPNAQKDKPVGDMQYRTDNTGRWGLLGLLGLLGLFGLRRNNRGK